MKQYLTILCTAQLIIVAPCTAMEKEQNYTTLNCIKNPRHARYLTHNNRAIINHLNGCSIIDPKADKEIIKISDDYSAHLAIHPNRKNFALSHKIKITVYTYDDKTDKVEQLWSLDKFPKNQKIYSSIFSPLDTTIITRHTEFAGFRKHNYITNKTASSQDPENIRLPPKIACHPTEPKICLAHSSGHLSIYTHNNKMELLNVFNLKHHHNFCEYNSNGSIIVCGNQNRILTLHLDLEPKRKYRIPNQENNIHNCIALHPNGSVLATLSLPHNIVRYWDMKTQELIDELPGLSNDPQIGNKDITFSCCGTELMIALSDRCVIAPVPFNVIYQMETKEKLPCLFWLLKNYKPDKCEILPRDVIRLFIHTLLETFRR